MSSVAVVVVVAVVVPVTIPVPGPGPRRALAGTVNTAATADRALAGTVNEQPDLEGAPFAASRSEPPYA